MHTNIQRIMFKKFSNIEAELKKCVSSKMDTFTKMDTFSKLSFKSCCHALKYLLVSSFKIKKLHFFLFGFPISPSFAFFNKKERTPRTLFKACSKKMLEYW